MVIIFRMNKEVQPGQVLEESGVIVEDKGPFHIIQRPFGEGSSSSSSSILYAIWPMTEEGRTLPSVADEAFALSNQWYIPLKGPS